MSQQEQQQEQQPKRRIEVDADALFALLSALNGHGHEIRELQATRSLDHIGLSMGTRNPINVLTEEWNAYAEKVNGVQKPAEGEAKNEQG